MTRQILDKTPKNKDFLRKTTIQLELLFFFEEFQV